MRPTKLIVLWCSMVISAEAYSAKNRDVVSNISRESSLLWSDATAQSTGYEIKKAVNGPYLMTSVAKFTIIVAMRI